MHRFPKLIALLAIAVLAPACNFYAWGANDHGQLGSDPGGSVSTPMRNAIDAEAGEKLYSQVAAGGSHSCGHREDGNVLCWGANDHGQLGDGTTTSSSDAVLVTIPTDGWIDRVTAGRSHSCAIVQTSGSTSEAWCWGDNRAGQVGGSGNAVLTPRLVPTPDPNWRWASISAGGQHTCAARSSGELYCWGANDRGQLGDGTNAASSTPVRVNAAVANVPQPDWMHEPSAGEDHTCAITNQSVGGPDGQQPEMYCWGANERGQLGDGTTTDRNEPVKLFGQNWGGVSAGVDHTCGWRTNRVVSCWGANDRGQLGDGTTTDRRRPVPIESGWHWVSVGDDFTCASREYVLPNYVLALSRNLYSVQLWCWGANDHGQLGTGTTGDQITPTAITGDLVFGKRTSACNSINGCSEDDWRRGRDFDAGARHVLGPRGGTPVQDSVPRD